MTREQRLLPDGKPRYIRCYDDGGKGIDRYTVVYGKKNYYVGMSGAPYHPQGVCQHGEGVIDRPSYGHLGKRISFDSLPADCQSVVLSDYKELWGLNHHVVIGHYNRYGYKIFEMVEGQVVTELYHAGNCMYDSDMELDIGDTHAESLGAIRAYCFETGRTIAKEHGLRWGGAEREV